MLSLLFLIFIVYSIISIKKSHINGYVHPEFRDIKEVLKVSGNIEPFKEIDVKSPISGVLEELYVSIGDEVKKGQALAKVQFVKDPLEYKSLLNQQDIYKAKFDRQSKSFDRAKKLHTSGVISDLEYESEYSDFLVSKAEYESIIAEIQMVRGLYINKDISNIVKATGDGTILELPIKEGGSVMARGTLNEGTSIAKIADLKSLIFKAYVLESDIMRIKIGMPIKVFTATDLTGKGVRAVVSMIAPKAQKSEKGLSFEVNANIVPEDVDMPFIRAGSSAIGECIVAQRESVLSVEEKYLIYKNEVARVKLLGDDGVVTERTVQLGASDGIYTEVENGLDLNSKICTDDN